MSERASGAKLHWLRLLKAAERLTKTKLSEEIQVHPWRRPLPSEAPPPAKPALARDYEVGLVYPVTDEAIEARAACGLPKIPPTAHLYRESVYEKRRLLETLGVLKRFQFNGVERRFKY